MSNRHNCRQKDNNHAIKAGVLWLILAMLSLITSCIGPRRSQIRVRRSTRCPCARVCVCVQVWLTFPKARQIWAEQVPIDWLVENRDLRAAVHRLHTLLRWMLYRYRGPQELVVADEEKQEFCDLWIDFLHLMWKMSHKANIKVIIFLQGLTSNLC